jgi:UPF0755 protein
MENTLNNKESSELTENIETTDSEKLAEIATQTEQNSEIIEENSYEVVTREGASSNSKKTRAFVTGFFLLVLFGLIFIAMQWLGPVKLNQEIVVTIPEGYSVRQTSRLLQEQKVIASSFGFEILARLTESSVQAGRYQFVVGNHPLSSVLKRISESDYGDAYITITIPEGSNIKEIAEIVARNPELGISKEKFLEASKGLEGYLFPDTYYFVPGDTEQEVINKLKENFQEKIQKYESAIEASPYSLDEVIIMASILEREATGNQTEMQTVSGILWKRIREGIRLQVDAPFMYEIGKTSSQLTMKDLSSSSPYNTYRNTGLTPTPIGNPGIEAIYAAFNPIETPYYFYLHDLNGGIHYAEDFDGHIANKNRYLK